MPQGQLSFWNNELVSENACSLSGLSRKIIQHSIHFHNKGYMGHQVAVTLPLTALTNALIGYMNNCTTVYELGMVGNAMEKVMLSHLAEKYGYDKQATGFITSGFSEKDYHKQAIMVSEEAHYSVERATKILGIQSDCIIKVPTGEEFSIRVDLMESHYEKALSQGKIVFCVVGCACTTSVGAHDNLKMLADFTEKHHIWFHVDGAHGGAAIFSDRYKYLLEGIERSDSLIVDFHKMMMTPPLSTAILYNAGNRKITR